MCILLTSTMLYTLYFAEDQILIVEDCDDSNYMTRNLIEDYVKWSLQVNIDIIISRRTVTELDVKRWLTYSILSRVQISNNKRYKGQNSRCCNYRKKYAREKSVSLLNSIFWDKCITKEKNECTTS